MMSICLKTHSKHANPSAIELMIQHRLPEWLQPPCRVHCTFLITSISDYYLLTLTITGTLSVTCQRCLEDVNFKYYNSIEIALCRSDERAEALMSSYDCMVVVGDFLDLEAVVVDELHLSLPQIPHGKPECCTAV